MRDTACINVRSPGDCVMIGQLTDAELALIVGSTDEALAYSSRDGLDVARLRDRLDVELIRRRLGLPI